MEVVSTSNLVSTKTEKTTACSFHQIIPWEINMNMKQNVYKYEAIRSFVTAEMVKSTLRNTYTQNSKIKTNQQ